MEATNGTARERLREARTRVKELSYKIQAKRLERTANMLEGVSDATVFDWVQAYASLLDRIRSEPNMFAMSTIYDRRYGRDFPMFQTEQDLALLRMSSRILCGTNGYAMRLQSSVESYVIGEGFSYRATPTDENDQPLADAVQEVIDDFIRRNEFCGGVQDSLESELLVRSMEDGEFFLAHFKDNDGNTDVRTVEPEQVRQPPGTQQKEWFFGIQSDADDTQSVYAINVVWGDNINDGEQWSPDKLTHFKRNVKRSIKRGMPDFAFDIHDALNLGSKLRRNMQTGAAIQAALAEIRQYDNANQGQVTNLQSVEANLQATNAFTGQTEFWAQRDRGTRLDIPKGFNYIPPPAYANTQSFVDILHAGLRGATGRWCMPSALITGSDDEAAAFSSQVNLTNPFIIKVRQAQSRYREAYLRSIWIAVENKVRAKNGLPVVIRKGGVTISPLTVSLEEIRRKITIQVEAPNPIHKDELNEAQANSIRSQAKVLSPQTWMQLDGLDVDQEMSNWEEWNERMGPMLPELQLPGEGEGDKPAAPNGKEEARAESR